MSLTCDLNLTCDIVCDLAPLYKDGVASPDSKRAIEKHLKTCQSCREFYKKTNPPKIKKEKAPPKKVGEYTALATMISKKQRREYIISNALVYGIAGVSIALTVVGLIKAYRGK